MGSFYLLNTVRQDWTCYDPGLLNFSNGISFMLLCFSSAVSVDVIDLTSPTLLPTVYDCLSPLRARTLQALTAFDYLCYYFIFLLFNFRRPHTKINRGDWK